MQHSGAARLNTVQESLLAPFLDCLLMHRWQLKYAAAARPQAPGAELDLQISKLVPAALPPSCEIHYFTY